MVVFVERVVDAADAILFSEDMNKRHGMRVFTILCQRLGRPLGR